MAIVVLLLIGVVFVQTPCLLSFDAVIKEEHDSHPGDWKRDGRPQGFFWGTGSGIWSRMLVGCRERYFVTWLFTTPRWALRSQSAKANLRRFRMFAALGVVFAAICLALIC